MVHIDDRGVSILLLGLGIIVVTALAFRDSRKMIAAEEAERKRLWRSVWFMLAAVLVYLPATAVLAKIWWDNR